MPAKTSQVDENDLNVTVEEALIDTIAGCMTYAGFKIYRGIARKKNIDII